MKILITGGAGFVGSQLAYHFRQKFPESEIVVLDNLRRRGSELNVPRLKSWGVNFLHGDIREYSDIVATTRVAQHFDLFVEASAEPSVLAGTQGDSPLYAIQTNLSGTVNCLEFARAHCGAFMFLSTSRVYSIPELQWIPLEKGKSRFEVQLTENQRGLTEKGINEDFSTSQFRSIYGATKLASELLIQEYVHSYGLKAIINRCSVLCGPWQMGKVDQGVFTLWMAKHFFGGSLSYTGYEGTGFQVRDLLHPRDLASLVVNQYSKLESWKGDVFNVGGGPERSVSLFELTELCQKISGKQIEITSTPKTSSVDVPYFVTDSSKVEKAFQWKPQVSVPEILAEIHDWLKSHADELKHLF